MRRFATNIFWILPFCITIRAAWVCTATDGELVNIVFESGSIAADPSWDLLRYPADLAAQPRARIGPTGRSCQQRRGSHCC